MKKRILLILFFTVATGIASKAQFRSSISFVPEVQLGYSSLSFKEQGEASYTSVGGLLTQVNAGLHIPYSKNLSIRVNTLFNRRNGGLHDTVLISNAVHTIKIQVGILNIGFDAALMFSKYYKKNRALYFGLGYFINYGVGGTVSLKVYDLNNTVLESESLYFKGVKEIFKSKDAILGRKNDGIQLKLAYKTGKRIYASCFYNLGLKNIRSDQLAKFSSLRTNDIGLSLGYFIRTD